MPIASYPLFLFSFFFWAGILFSSSRVLVNGGPKSPPASEKA